MNSAASAGTSSGETARVGTYHEYFPRLNNWDSNVHIRDVIGMVLLKVAKVVNALNVLR